MFKSYYIVQNKQKNKKKSHTLKSPICYVGGSAFSLLFPSLVVYITQDVDVMFVPRTGYFYLRQNNVFLKASFLALKSMGVTASDIPTSLKIVGSIALMSKQANIRQDRRWDLVTGDLSRLEASKDCPLTNSLCWSATFHMASWCY